MNLEEIRRCHAQAAKSWTGCDWPTRFGQAQLNLQGRSAADAEAFAHTRGKPDADDWLAAARWLTQIEQSAERAEMQAALALAAANAGDLTTALEHAQTACALEQTAGRLAGGGRKPIWTDLRQAIDRALHSQQQPHFQQLPSGKAARLGQEMKALARTLDQLAERVLELEVELATVRSPS